MKRRALPFVIAMVLLCAVCMNCNTVRAEENNPNTVTIRILHTNDIHGRSSFQENTTVGFEKMAAYFQQQQADLMVDVGDFFHGQAFATLEQGGSMAELMKTVGYDAMTPGNHDWNYGKERLKELDELADTPILAGNIFQEGQNFFGNDGTLIKEVNGVKIGLLGVFDQDIKNDTAPRNIEGLSFENDAQTAAELAAKLRAEGCEIVIALSHQLRCEEFVSQIKGIDVLIAGHEHSTLDEVYSDAEGKAVNVVEAGCYFENAGLLSIDYSPEEKQIISVEESLLTSADAASVPSDESVTALLQAIDNRQKQTLSQVVGTTGQELDGRWENLRIGETCMGRLVTAAYLYETGADIAFENAGGIRLGRLLPAGNLTYQDIVDTAPYGNYIVTKEITGNAVLSILEKSIDIGLQNQKSYEEWLATGSDQVPWPDDNGSYLQFGGLAVEYDPLKPIGERVVSAKVGEEPLDGEQLYTIATNNYISLGKAFSELADVPELNQYAACDEALIRFMQLGQEYVDAAVEHVGLQSTSKGDVPEVEPSDYSFEIKYVDVHGDPAPDGGRQYFDTAGKFSRENIPIPHGYQQADIPAEPDDGWLNPTSLEFMGGQWTVTNPVVTIEVEKQACVRVVFKLEDGTVLEDMGYEEYFGETGMGQVTVQAPEGYELIGSDCYAIEVIRDEKGRLTSDSTEAVFKVKKISAVKPEEPFVPEKPSVPDNPSRPKTSSAVNGKEAPQTGDNSSDWLLWTGMFSLAGISIVITVSKRQKKL